MSTIKPQTLETLISDQTARIERCQAPAGSNLILDWINDINYELKKTENEY